MRILTSTMLAVAVAACSTTAQLTPRTSESQQALFNDGHLFVRSTQPRSRVVLSPGSQTFKYEGRISLAVEFASNLAAPVDVSTENISVMVAGEPQKVFTYDDLVEEQEEREMWQRVALAVSAAGDSMAAASAGTTYQSGTVSTYGSGGSAYGTYAGTTYNAAAAQTAQRQVQERVGEDAAAITSAGNATREALAGQILKRNTLLPGSSVSGRVLVDAPSPSTEGAPMVITVRIGDETHSFAFDYQRQE